MTGPPRPMLEQALTAGDLRRVRLIASAMPSIHLADAARIVALIEIQEPHNTQAAKMQWLRRFTVERARVVDEVAAAVTALRDMRADPLAAVAALRQLCS